MLDCSVECVIGQRSPLVALFRAVTCALGLVLAVVVALSGKKQGLNKQEQAKMAEQQPAPQVAPPLPHQRKAPSKVPSPLLPPMLERNNKPPYSNGNDEGGKVMILSVDCSVTDQMVVQTMLDPDKFLLVRCYSGEEAMEWVETSQYLPDIILLATTLQEISGHKVCALLRRKYSNTDLPIILISSQPSENDLLQGLARGANDYMAKPLYRLELLARIQTQLKVHQAIKAEAECRSQYTLLSQILPPHIIARLKSGERLISESHPRVTILFSDVVGFTSISQRWSTDRVVQLLNAMFTMFDGLCEHHKVYKVETIGDAYMIVCGHDGEVDHCERMMAMGQDMIRMVEQLHVPYQDEKIRIRVGLHTGPAYSGVVGVQRPRYCFFGDTVNTASRMESHGFPMTVHVSEVVYQHLKSRGYSDVDFCNLGPRHIKGKGVMRTYVAKVGQYKEALSQRARPSARDNFPAGPADYRHPQESYFPAAALLAGQVVDTSGTDSPPSSTPAPGCEKPPLDDWCTGNGEWIGMKPHCRQLSMSPTPQRDEGHRCSRGRRPRRHSLLSWVTQRSDNLHAWPLPNDDVSAPHKNYIRPSSASLCAPPSMGWPVGCVPAKQWRFQASVDDLSSKVLEHDPRIGGAPPIEVFTALENRHDLTSGPVGSVPTKSDLKDESTAPVRQYRATIVLDGEDGQPVAFEGCSVGDLRESGATVPQESGIAARDQDQEGVGTTRTSNRPCGLHHCFPSDSVHRLPPYMVDCLANGLGDPVPILTHSPEEGMPSNEGRPCRRRRRSLLIIEDMWDLKVLEGYINVDS